MGQVLWKWASSLCPAVSGKKKGGVYVITIQKYSVKKVYFIIFSLHFERKIPKYII